MSYGAYNKTTAFWCRVRSGFYDDATSLCFDAPEEYAAWALDQADKCRNAGSPSPFFDVNVAHCVPTASGTPVTAGSVLTPSPPPSTEPPPERAGTTDFLAWGIILLVAGGILYGTVGRGPKS